MDKQNILLVSIPHWSLCCQCCQGDEQTLKFISGHRERKGRARPGRAASLGGSLHHSSSRHLVGEPEWTPDAPLPLRAHEDVCRREQALFPKDSRVQVAWNLNPWLLPMLLSWLVILSYHLIHYVFTWGPLQIVDVTLFPKTVSFFVSVS